MFNPKVSIIVPLYNNKKYIHKCILSLVNQTHKNIEVLIIDDGSTDGSFNQISDLLTDKRIIYSKQQNLGVSLARNLGIELATGDYITFVDSDDFVDVSYIKTLLDSAIKYNSDLCVCGYNLVKNNKVYYSFRPKIYESNNDEMSIYRIMGVWCRLYKKTFFTYNHLLFTDEKGARGEDIPVSLLSNLLAKNITVVSEPLYYYVQHKNQSTNFKTNGFFKFPYNAFEKAINIADNSSLLDTNSIDYFRFSILKTLAHFKYFLYLKAPHQYKKELNLYILRLLKNNYKVFEKSFNIVLRKNKVDLKIYYPIRFLLIYIKIHSSSYNH